MLLIVFILSLATGGSCDIEPYIYNGTAAEIGNFPYLVSLQLGDEHFCGGAIYDNDLIVTAAHCLGFQKPDDVRIVAGRTNLAVTSNEEQILMARSFLLHPNYSANRTHVRNDIALIRTKSKFSWRTFVQPALINLNWKYASDESIKIAGWGITFTKGPLSDQLLSVALDVQNDDKCEKAFPGSYQPESTFCLYSEGKNTCPGDSGSPTTNSDKQVVGLVSYGTRDCTKNEPMVATRINSYISWIEEQRKKLNEDCGEATNLVDSVTDTGLAVIHSSAIQRQALESNHEKVCGPTWKLNCFGKECFCYTLIKSRLAWHEAGERCGRYGGELVSIMSDEENSFVGSFVPSRFEKMWIGLNDLTTSGKLVWPERTLSYSSWHHESQPDPLTNRCVDMDYHLLWKRSDCEIALSSVCKVPISQKDSGRRCQLGWAIFDGYCYQLQASLLNWDEASRNCEKNGAQLVSVHNRFEYDFVTAAIADAGKDYVWIGLNDQEKEGVFVWSDNSDIQFTAWDRGQPNNAGPENCVSVHMPTGKWHDYRCWLKFPSICKKKIF